MPILLKIQGTSTEPFLQKIVQDKTLGITAVLKIKIMKASTIDSFSPERS